MTMQPGSAGPPQRRSGHRRRVVLEAVVRRDAAQRLSLALTVLARASGAGPPGEAADPPLESRFPGPPRSGTQKERSA